MNRCWFLVGLGREDVKFQIHVVRFQRGLTGKPGRSLCALINQHIAEQRHGFHKTTECQRGLKFKAEMMREVEGAVRAVQEGHQDYEKGARPRQRKKSQCSQMGLRREQNGGSAPSRVSWSLARVTSFLWTFLLPQPTSPNQSTVLAAESSEHLCREVFMAT